MIHNTPKPSAGSADSRQHGGDRFIERLFHPQPPPDDDRRMDSLTNRTEMCWRCRGVCGKDRQRISQTLRRDGCDERPFVCNEQWIDAQQFTYASAFWSQWNVLLVDP